MEARRIISRRSTSRHRGSGSASGSSRNSSRSCSCRRRHCKSGFSSGSTITIRNSGSNGQVCYLGCLLVDFLACCSTIRVLLQDVAASWLGWLAAELARCQPGVMCPLLCACASASGAITPASMPSRRNVVLRCFCAIQGKT